MSDLVERLKAWPAAEQGDALSAGFVGGMMTEAADRISLLMDALKLAEQFLDKASALAEGKYRGSVPVLRDRLIEVRDEARTVLGAWDK